jgi:hypothetical protein
MRPYFSSAYASQSYSTLAQVVRSSVVAGEDGFGFAGNGAEQAALAHDESHCEQAANEKCDTNKKNITKAEQELCEQCRKS